MRLLMITQKIDEADPVLAFTVGWIRALAARVDHLHVLCLEQHVEGLSVPLPPNVTVSSMGKERGYGRVREFMAFQQVMARSIRGVDAVFVHMIPRYAWLGAPYALVCRKPQILWYTHRQVNWELRAAVAVCKYVATAVPESFPVQTPRLHAIGHGIDADFFAPDPQVCPDDVPLIVYVARLMPIKYQETLLRAAVTVPGAHVAIVGAVPSGQDPAYLDQLRAAARVLGIADRVSFTGGLRPDAVREMYRRAAVAVNLSPPGLFDKAALESMLTGVPTIVSNPAFDPLLGDPVERVHLSLRIRSPEDVPGLAASIRALLALPADERRRIGSDIRERAKAAHSLDNQMDRLVALFIRASAAGKS